MSNVSQKVQNSNRGNSWKSSGKFHNINSGPLESFHFPHFREDQGASVVRMVKRERERENSQLSVKIVTFDLVSKVHVQSHMLASKGQTQVMDYLQIPGIHIAKGGWYNHMIGKDPPSYVCWLIRTKHWQYPSLLF